MIAEETKETVQTVIHWISGKEGAQEDTGKICNTRRDILTEGHFDIESLYIFMKIELQGKPCDTYNTVELLLDSNLIVKTSIREEHCTIEKAYSIACSTIIWLTLKPVKWQNSVIKGLTRSSKVPCKTQQLQAHAITLSNLMGHLRKLKLIFQIFRTFGNR